MTWVKADVIRTFGTVFEDVSCEQVASKTLRAAFTWGGVADSGREQTEAARQVGSVGGDCGAGFQKEGGEMSAKQVPLAERLRSVPRDAVWIFNDVMSSSSYPVGLMCREAADEIAAHETAKFACMRQNQALRDKLIRILTFVLEFEKGEIPQLSFEDAICKAEQRIYDLRGALRAESDIAAQALQSVEDLTRSLAEMTEERNAFKASSEIRGANIEEMAKVFAELSAYFGGSALGNREMARKTRKMARAALDCSQ